jgi:hypothetical protein
MVRTTEHLPNGRRPLSWTARSAVLVALGCLSFVALLVVTGCSGGTAGSPSGSSVATPTTGSHMAGPAVDVHVTPEALASEPKPAVQTTPESAVRSYLDWTSYAYRIGQSNVASTTFTTAEEVRVDSYVQYNIQQLRLIDQTLKSITFGKSSVGSTSTLVPAHEQWTYRYVSIETAGKTIAGPYSAAYDSIYTVVKSKKGTWAVDSVKATAVGTVK